MLKPLLLPFDYKTKLKEHLIENTKNSHIRHSYPMFHGTKRNRNTKKSRILPFDDIRCSVEQCGMKHII